MLGRLGSFRAFLLYERSSQQYLYNTSVKAAVSTAGVDSIFPGYHGIVNLLSIYRVLIDCVVDLIVVSRTRLKIWMSDSGRSPRPVVMRRHRGLRPRVVVGSVSTAAKESFTRAVLNSVMCGTTPGNPT